MTGSNNVTVNFNILTVTVTQLLPKMIKIGPKLGPKYSFSSPRIIFGVFAKTSLKTVQNFTMDHSLKFPAKKKIFRTRLPGAAVQKQPKLSQNCIFVEIYTNLLRHFP